MPGLFRDTMLCQTRLGRSRWCITPDPVRRLGPHEERRRVGASASLTELHKVDITEKQTGCFICTARLLRAKLAHTTHHV
jgi:hypothetical protein